MPMHMPMALGGSQGGRRFLMSEVSLYRNPTARTLMLDPINSRLWLSGAVDSGEMFWLAVDCAEPCWKRGEPTPSQGNKATTSEYREGRTYIYITTPSHGNRRLQSPQRNNFEAISSRRIDFSKIRIVGFQEQHCRGLHMPTAVEPGLKYLKVYTCNI